jgi:cyclase
MPISYAGSVYSEEQVERLIKLGIEKIVLNSLFHNNFSEYKRILEIFGRSTISLSIDYKGNSQSNFVFTTSGKHNTNISVLDVIQKLNDLDAIPGELVLTSIYKDGSFSGLDFEMFNIVVDKINCPLVLNCGLSSYDEISLIENNSNLSGIMGSGLFVYASQIRGVLINYQLNEQLHHIKKILNYIYE